MRRRAVELLAWFWIVFSFSQAQAQKESEYSILLQPFTSDGCSAFPDGTLAQRKLWLSCCTDHDRAYWLGGSYQQRKIADQSLKQCVDQIGEPEIALIMLAGVRVGGSPYWFSSFRWGYGWPYLEGWLPRGYKELSDQDRKLAEDLMLIKANKEKDDTGLNSAIP